jgi:hypothetical protein
VWLDILIFCLSYYPTGTNTVHKNTSPFCLPSVYLLFTSGVSTFGLSALSPILPYVPIHLQSFKRQSYSTSRSPHKVQGQRTIIFYLKCGSFFTRRIIQLTRLYVIYGTAKWMILSMYWKRRRRHLLRLHVQNRRGHKPHISRHVMLANWAMSMGMRLPGLVWWKLTEAPSATCFKHDKYNNVCWAQPLSNCSFLFYGREQDNASSISTFSPTLHTSGLTQYFSPTVLYFWSHSIIAFLLLVLALVPLIFNLSNNCTSIYLVLLKLQPFFFPSYFPIGPILSSFLQSVWSQSTFGLSTYGPILLSVFLPSVLFCLWS